MGRDRGRSRRSSSRQGDSETRSSRSVSYTGAASWPIVEWSIKNELSQLGLPGSIVEHHIRRPAPPPRAAAPAAASTTPTSVAAPLRARASAPDAEENQTGDAQGPVDISSFQSQLEVLQQQLSALQASQSSTQSGSGEDEVEHVARDERQPEAVARRESRRGRSSSAS